MDDQEFRRLRHAALNRLYTIDLAVAALGLGCECAEEALDVLETIDLAADGLIDILDEVAPDDGFVFPFDTDPRPPLNA